MLEYSGEMGTVDAGGSWCPLLPTAALTADGAEKQPQSRHAQAQILVGIAIH